MKIIQYRFGKYQFLGGMLPKVSKLKHPKPKGLPPQYAMYDLKGHFVRLKLPSEHVDPARTGPTGRPIRGAFWRRFYGEKPPKTIDLTKVEWSPSYVPQGVVEVSDRGKKKRKVFGSVEACAEFYGYTPEQIRYFIQEGGAFERRYFRYLTHTTVTNRVNAQLDKKFAAIEKMLKENKIGKD